MSTWTPDPEVAAYMDAYGSGSSAENWRAYMASLPSDDRAATVARTWVMAQYEMIQRLHGAGLLKSL